ncbi:MAG: TIGR02147 family protein [Oligoflexales bacterium]
MKNVNQDITDYRDFLLNAYKEKRQKNSQYSLRSYAKFLGISAPQLSKILNRKQPLSLRHATQIADKLALSPSQRSQLATALNSELLLPTDARGRQEFLQLADDRFRLISDWWHFAILSLGSVRGNSKDPKWIATRLGITVQVAEDAFQRLLRLNLVEMVDGGYRQSGLPLSTTTDVPSSAIQKYHRQNLELAAEKLGSIPVDLREFTSITIAVDPNNIAKAKDAIRKFKRSMADSLGSGNKEEVYTLAIQLFPLTTQEDVK